MRGKISGEWRRTDALPFNLHGLDMTKLRKTVTMGGLFGDRVECVECPSKGLTMRPVDKSVIDDMMIRNHYSHTATQNSFISIGVYWHGELKGGMQLGYGIRPKIKGEYAPDETREFDRMWLSDDLPKFSETITISMLHLFLRKEYPQLKYLISYADTSAGMTGTIYRASNYKEIDRVKADFYILPDGSRLHPVSCWHKHKTRSWSFMEKTYPGIRKADGEQIKFLYQLH